MKGDTSQSLPTNDCTHQNGNINEIVLILGFISIRLYLLVMLHFVHKNFPETNNKIRKYDTTDDSDNDVITKNYGHWVEGIRSIIN